MGDEYYTDVPYYAPMPQFAGDNAAGAPGVFDLNRYEESASGFSSNSFGYNNEQTGQGQ